MTTSCYYPNGSHRPIREIIDDATRHPSVRPRRKKKAPIHNYVVISGKLMMSCLIHRDQGKVLKSFRKEVHYFGDYGRIDYYRLRRAIFKGFNHLIEKEINALLFIIAIHGTIEFWPVELERGKHSYSCQEYKLERVNKSQLLETVARQNLYIKAWLQLQIIK